MGLLTSLALLVAPLATRFKRESTDELERKIKGLVRDLEDARMERDTWETLARRWEARYRQAINPILAEETRAQVRLMHAMAQHQQGAQMAAQQAQNFYGILGAQQGFCNCVPARHDALLGLGQVP